MKRKNVILELEELRQRIVPATAQTQYWVPISTANSDWNYTITQNGHTWTNWCTSPTAAPNNLNRIEVTANSGYPGQKTGANIAILTGKDNQNCNMQGLAWGLSGFIIGTDTDGYYVGTITQKQATIQESGSAGHFQMREGTFDLHGNKYTLEDITSTNLWDGGTIEDTVGGGSFNVFANNADTILDIGREPILNANMWIGGSFNVPGEGIAYASVIMSNMTGDLTVGANWSITVDAAGILQLSQLNSAQTTNAMGGFYTSGVCTNYVVNVQGGGLLQRGLGPTYTTAMYSVRSSRPIHIEAYTGEPGSWGGGMMEICPNCSMDITGEDISGVSVYVTGEGNDGITPSKLVIDATNIDVCGFLKTDGGIQVWAGAMLKLEVDKSGNDPRTVLYEIDNGGAIDIKSGSDLYVQGTSNNGVAKVNGDVIFESGSTFMVDGWGLAGSGDPIEELWCNGSCNMSSGATLFVLIWDNTPLPHGLIDALYAAGGLTGGFGTNKDSLVPSNTYNSNEMANYYQIWW